MPPAGDTEPQRQFFGGLASSVTACSLYVFLCSKFAGITSTEVKLDRSTAVSRGFGFANFDSEVSGGTAML